MAQFTQLAALTGKATKSTTEEMGSLFATGYGIYKGFYDDMSDLEFGEMFSAGIATAVKNYKTSGSEMASAISALGATATNANVPLEEQLAIMGQLQTTMSGSEAATKYKSFLNQASSAGEKLGLTFLDTNNQLLSMPDILTELKSKYEASVELGYEDDFDSLIDGYVRCGDTDYWKEIMIKDDMMKLDRVTIKASFVDCEPQDVIRYVLACAGIEDYVLSDEHYGKKDLFVIDRKSGINTIAEVNSSWGIKNPFFFQKKVFYWGTKEEQKEIYVLEEGETILSLNKYGDLWEAETIAIPWIHHSQEVEVQHSKYSGIVTVEKTIVRSDDTGAVHMYIYFAGGEKDV